MKITKKMRFLLIALSVVMVLSLFACGDTPEETTTKAPDTTEQKPTEPTETTEKTEKTEPKEPTETTETPVVDTTDSDSETTDATEGSTESGSETTETGSETGSATETTEADTTETTEAPACEHEVVIDPAIAPTCEDTGLTEGKHCAVCGAVLVAQSVVDALGHKWDEGTVTTKPECGEAGEALYTCEHGCGETKTEIIAALEHVWDEGVVTTAPTCTEKGVKTLTCTLGCGETKTEEIDANGHTPKEKDVTDNCNVKCDVCGALIAEGQHAADRIEADWKLLEETDEEGKLQEAKRCLDCGQIAEKRAVVFRSTFEAVYVDGKLANPQKDGLKTEGCGGFDTKICYLDASKLVDSDGNALVVTDSLSVGGWLAIAGGVERYVFRINDGEWVTAVGNANDVAADDKHIGQYISATYKDLDETAFKKANYQTRLAVPDLQAYADQTVTVTFGAVPAGYAGEESDPNVHILAVISNLKVECNHSGNENEYSFDSTNPQYLVSDVCSVCGTENATVPMIDSPEGLVYFGAEEIADKKGTLMTDENGIKFSRINAAKTRSEEYFFLYANADESLTNVGKYIAFMARCSNKDNYVDIFLDSTASEARGGGRQFAKFATGMDGWTLFVAAYNATSNGSVTWYDGTKVTAFRFDAFNGPADRDWRTTSDFIDVAFVSFFSTEQAAYDYYEAFVDSKLGQEGCAHYKYSGEWESTGNVDEMKNVCALCDKDVVVACVHSKKTTTPTDDVITYQTKCALCGHSFGAETGINQEGLTVLTPDKLIGVASTQEGGGKPASATVGTITNKVDEICGNMPYMHVLIDTAATAGESYINLKFTEAVKGVGKFVTVIYRSQGTPAGEMFISSTGGIQGGQNISSTTPAFSANSNGWQLAVFDFTSKTNWDNNTGIKTIRWDINCKVTPGMYLDVACLTFFNSYAEAEAFFTAYSAQYNLNYQYKMLFNGISVNDTIVVNNIASVGKTYVRDFAGVELNDAQSIKIDSWFSAVKGTEKYSIRIIDGENVVTEDWFVGSDRTDDVMPDMKKQAYYESAGFTEDCGKGAGHGTRVIDLTGYEGKTVTVQMIAHTLDGKEIVTFSFINIAVPEAADDENAG